LFLFLSLEGIVIYNGNTEGRNQSELCEINSFPKVSSKWIWFIEIDFLDLNRLPKESESRKQANGWNKML